MAVLIYLFSSFGNYTEGEGEFSGIVSFGFETQSFKPCDSPGERWWIWFPNQSDLVEYYSSLASRDFEPIYFEIEGIITESGNYGHLGSYNRELRPFRVIAANNIIPSKCEVSRES